MKVRKTIKYPKNTAEQCLTYSNSVKQFLSSALSETQYKERFDLFLCCNMCRDACTMAISNSSKDAKKLINAFYGFPEFCDVLDRRVYRDAGKKYRVVGEMLRLRYTELLILCAKGFKKLIFI